MVEVIGPSYYTAKFDSRCSAATGTGPPASESYFEPRARLADREEGSERMKIYTKTGDQGETGLFGGPRVRKDDVRIEAYGTVDELNAFLGQARAEELPAEIAPVIARAQNCLFTIGAELATPTADRQRIAPVPMAAIEELEVAIDRLESELPPLREFILPGGNRASAALHVARCVCRRAERRVVTLAQQEGVAISDGVIQYLNRLSDYLFVAARFACHAAGDAEITWRKD